MISSMLASKEFSFPAALLWNWPTLQTEKQLRILPLQVLA